VELVATSRLRDGLTSAIHTKVESSLIIQLSCGNTLKSPLEPAPFGCGPQQAFPHRVRSAIVHSQDRDESRLRCRASESLFDYRPQYCPVGHQLWLGMAQVGTLLSCLPCCLASGSGRPECQSGQIAVRELRWRGFMSVCVAMNESTMSVTEVCREVAAHC
jgi:hypothetical protein